MPARCIYAQTSTDPGSVRAGMDPCCLSRVHYDHQDWLHTSYVKVSYRLYFTDLTIGDF